MKRSKRTVKKEDAQAAPEFRMSRLRYALAFAATAVAALIAYGPALRGQFVFDDLDLSVTAQDFINMPLRGWLSGVRPLLMLSYWLNFKLYGTDPLSYHLFNVFCHIVTTALVFLTVRKLVSLAGESGLMREALSGFAAGLFLLHPIQTEAVAYISSRSEALSVLFFHAALAAFLYRRREAISWLSTFLVLILFAVAVNTKEHAVALPAVLLLTDYYFNPGFSLKGALRNWRLYGLIAMGGAFALRMALNVLRYSDTAGFGLKDFTWYQYLYTQGRVIWVYIRLFFLPYGQTVDYDFPISRTPLDHGAIFGLLALGALAAAAILFRRRYPLASYGYLVFLALLAPTSSVVPILDPIAERRMYLPLIGLLLVVVEFARRWKTSHGRLAAAMAGVLFVAGALTYYRAELWSTAEALWSDAAGKSPGKQRVQLQLAYDYLVRGRCQDALAKYEMAARIGPADYRVLVDWGLAYDCLGREEEALAKLRQAIPFNNSAHVHALIGMVYAKRRKAPEALAALAEAEKLDPGFGSIYVYRGAVYQQTGEWEAAAREFRRALSLNPSDEQARVGLAQTAPHLRGGR